MRTQVAPVGSRTSRSRPPEAIRRTCVEVAIGKVVVASTQELERPFINTVVVGGAGKVQLNAKINKTPNFSPIPPCNFSYNAL